MSRMHLIVVCLVLFSVAGIYLYFNRERDWGPALDAVFNAQIESVTVAVYTPDDELTETIQLDIDSVHRLDVKGTFIGPASSDFMLVSGQNKLFKVSIVQGDQVVWSNSPIRIEPHGSHGFSFSRKFKLPKNLPPGSYLITCDYNRVNVASKKVQVVK